MKRKQTAAMILAVIVIMNLCAGISFSLAAADPESVKIVVAHTNGVVTQDDVAKAGQKAGLCSLEEDAFGEEHWIWKDIAFAVTFASVVTSIGDWAFYGCTQLTGVTIPSTVKSIGKYAFYGTSLISITIPKGVTSIGGNAFTGCKSMTGISVNKDNAKYSSENGVLFNKKKTGLIQYPAGKTDSAYAVPSSVKTIGNSAFSYCEALTKATLPKSVTSISSWAFYGCHALTTLTLGAGVTSIGEEAFAWCTKLIKVTIPDSVISLGKRAFYACYALTNVTVGAGVTSIGDEAFAWCASLSSATIVNSKTVMGKQLFSYYPVGLTIHCRKDSTAYTYAIETGIEYDFLYIVKFNSKGGTTVKSVAVQSDKAAKAPKNPTRKGYVFKGWTIDNECKKAYDWDTKVTKDITLYAKWEANKAAITTGKTVRAGKTLKLTVQSGNASIQSVVWTTSKKANVKIASGAKKKTVTLTGMKKGKTSTIKVVVTFKDGSKKTLTRVVTVR